MDSRDFAALPLKKLRDAINKGLLRPGPAKELLDAAKARKQAEHAAKIGENEFRKWSAPWDHAVHRLNEELKWALQRRRYMRTSRFDHMTQPAETFFNTYIAQIVQVRGVLRVQRRRPEDAALAKRVKRGTSAEVHKVMLPTSKWSDYMVDKYRRALEQAYWDLMSVDGNALGKRGAPLLLDAAPEACPMHGYAGVPAAEPPKYVTKEPAKRPHLRNMARSTLTVKRVRELLDYDPETGYLSWREARRGAAWGSARAGASHNTGYRSICIDGVLVAEAHVVWLHVHGRWPVSHLFRRNGLPDDNRVENLYEKVAGRPVSADSGAVTPVKP
jgi:hypothetical protein